MRKFGVSLVIVLWCTNYSCIDTITVDLPENSAGRLVVDGVVERSPDIYRFFVRVSRTKDLQTEIFDAPEDADILLIYNNQPLLTLLNGIADTISIARFHELHGGTPDQATFNIRVSTPDGKVFESTAYEVLDSPRNSEIFLNYEVRSELNQFENVVERGYVKVLINSSLLNEDQERVSLRWDVSGVYRFPEVPWTDDPFFLTKICYVKDFIAFNEVNVLNSSNINGDQVREFEIGETIADFRFAAGYYYTVVQKAIHTGAAIYWDQVRQSIEREGTIFDAPVGAITTNIKQVQGMEEDVLGYFYTAGIDTIRHLSTREETGFQPLLCAFQLVSEACCDCLILVNSSLDKPIYWQQ